MNPITDRWRTPRAQVRVLLESLRIAPGPRVAVVDPFAGGGAVLDEARARGFRVLGYELEPGDVAGVKHGVDAFGLTRARVLEDADADTLVFVTNGPWSRQFEVLELLGRLTRRRDGFACLVPCWFFGSSARGRTLEATFGSRRVDFAYPAGNVSFEPPNGGTAGTYRHHTVWFCVGLVLRRRLLRPTTWRESLGDERPILPG